MYLRYVYRNIPKLALWFLGRPRIGLMFYKFITLILSFLGYRPLVVIMDEEYGDGSEHMCCTSCGLCVPCGDCNDYGCGVTG